MAEITILHYRRLNGEVPIKIWLDAIDDKVALATVLTRIDRLASGSFGDWKPVGGGVGNCAYIWGLAITSISVVREQKL